PSALVRELVRQWWGRSPGWTLALTGMGSPWSALIIGGLVKRLLTTFVGEGYPFPAPQPLVAETILAGTVSVQNWSMLTMSLRLLAGAMGVPFMSVGPELVDAHDVAPAARRGDGSPVHADATVARLLHGGGQRARRRLSRGRRPVRGGRRPDRGCCGVPDGNPDRVREGARARRGALPRVGGGPRGQRARGGPPPTRGRA